MWRDQTKDLNEIANFVHDIQEFQKLKVQKWERVDEKIQMENPPGTPGEDWIIPPDEETVAAELLKDPEYKELRFRILAAIIPLKEMAQFLHFDEHHDFDWINFTSPLIGNSALEDGIAMAQKLKKSCENHNYSFQNLVCLFKKSK